MKEELDKDVMYYYLRMQQFDHRGNICAIPYGTVAIRKNEDGTINRGISLCSKKDNFSRSIGRRKAYARLKKVEHYEKPVLLGQYGGDKSKACCPLLIGHSWDTLGYFHDLPTKTEEKMLK
ncbi:MAG: hypothetical protein WCQ80_02620 [Bacilli bacterium]